VKLWEGRMGGGLDPEVEAFTSSLPFDERLVTHDIHGSLAHARMLGRRGIIPPEAAAALVRELEALLREAEAGRLRPAPEDEDVHTTIERHLVQRLGPDGGRLHTARSRNDQVALDLHLWARAEIIGVRCGLLRLQRQLADAARRCPGLVMPGYTHLQRAQPVLFSFHLLAYFFMFDRDQDRLADVHRRAGDSPLGAAALAGTPHPVDPEQTAAELGLSGVYENAMDAVSDCDYLCDLLAALSLIAVHLSRLAEEVVLWSSAEFGFIELNDGCCTGSSIMPQKRNPDAAELLRALPGRVTGSLIGCLTILKGLPLAYNRDVQAMKPLCGEAVDAVCGGLGVAARIVAGLRPRAAAMAAAAADSGMLATDIADELVRRGVPFRRAHGLVAEAVRECAGQGRDLAALSDDEWAARHPLLPAAAAVLRDPSLAVARRSSPGGTAPESVRRQLERARRRLAELEAGLDRRADT